MSAEKTHFIGIGGVGMAALAVLLRNRGRSVSGCDLASTPRTRWLESLGIRVSAGHDPAHLDGCDEVVVTPAVARTNPELAAWCAAPGRRPRFRGEVLAELVSAASDSVAVCGSHGKTTTATYCAKLLRALGEDVEWAIGGETRDFPVAGRTVPKRPSPRPPVLVVEADESDGTLALYRAKTLVVTNCEYDHPDHFPTVADYVACYDAARAHADDVVESASLAVPDWLSRLPAFAALAPHNRANARAAVEVALRRGHAPNAIAAALPASVAELPDRRFERVWPVADDASAQVRVYTDYAHHPTEIRCAVGMARAVTRGTLRVLFQPHRHSRTRALLSEFPAAFAGADELVLCPVYAAFEQPCAGGDIADLYCAVRESPSAPRRLLLARSCAEAWEHARNAMRPGDVTLLLGAGDIAALLPRVKDDLASSVRPAPRRIFIGAGTNTWRSDLELSVEYVKTSGPAARPGAELVKAHPALCPWMAGIPGTVGGWIKMNAGAFGHSISEVVESVCVDGAWLPREACGFSYRHSEIAGEISDVRWNLSAALPDAPSPADFLARRRKFPPGTRGSVFRNPEGDCAGRLLEAAGAKGLRVGGAAVWSEHANVIVSGPDATAGDFLALARLMRNLVLFRFGIRLEPEVTGLDL